MWELNKRLEAYLARVKVLEEENEALRAEIQSARSGPAGDQRRGKYEEELRALRDALRDAYSGKCAAELARDSLYEEVQQVRSRCQKEQAAREAAKQQLSVSRKELEEERRAQIWLKESAVRLQKEVEALLEVHEEEKAGLEQDLAGFSQSLESFRCAPVAFQPLEVEDYSKRLSEIWKGAVETYKTEVSQLEGSLCQAKDSLWKAVEETQQSQLQLQRLGKDLAGLKARKEMLEESLSRQWQEQRGEAEKFQVGEGAEQLGGTPVPTSARTRRAAPGHWVRSHQPAWSCCSSSQRSTRCWVRAAGAGSWGGHGQDKLQPTLLQLQPNSCKSHSAEGEWGWNAGIAPGEGALFVPGPGISHGHHRAREAKDASFPRWHPAVLNPADIPPFATPPHRFVASFLSSPPLPILSPPQTKRPGPLFPMERRVGGSRSHPHGPMSGRAGTGLRCPCSHPAAGAGGPGAGEADAAGADRPGPGGQAAAHAPQDVP